MPVLTVEWVGAPPPDGLAQRLADAAGLALGTPPGRTWVRLRHLTPARYAENDVARAPEPVFVELLVRAPTDAPTVGRLTRALARACDRSPEQVHVLVLPAAAGRMFFGGVPVE
ncbi:MAG: hypothetical protein H6702_22620 [Myxococcales bacterium]|nr:hypothetical protein [Myxococcales bacterium]